MLLHLVDGTQDDPGAAWRTIRHEIEAYGHGLEEKPEIVALNKADALGPDLGAYQRDCLAEACGRPVFLCSGVSGGGCGGGSGGAAARDRPAARRRG